MFKLNVARALACTECRRCFRRTADAAKHRCKDPKGPKRLLANLKKEKRTALQWLHTKQGFTKSQIETLFNHAINRAQTAASLMYHRA